LTLPFTSLNAPLILSFVVDFIRRIARYVHSGCNLVWTSSRSADGEPKLRESPPPLKRQRSIQETAETFIAHSALPKLAISDASLFLTLIPPRPASEAERMFTERRDAFSGSTPSGIPKSRIQGQASIPPPALTEANEIDFYPSTAHDCLSHRTQFEGDILAPLKRVS
jgi:hypothetical protein